ncbi:MAG TPA: type II toxin-antitoxin system Phd/YefM family antitoxin [Nakamurella sp.]
MIVLSGLPASGKPASHRRRRPHGHSWQRHPPAPDNLCATFLYMTTLPLAEARANLSRLIDEAVTTHQRIEVTRKGRRAAVILSADDYDSIMETLDILSDPDLMRDIREGEAELDRGESVSLETVTEEMRANGRLPR